MLLYIYFGFTAFCQVFCAICFHVFRIVSKNPYYIIYNIIKTPTWLHFDYMTSCWFYCIKRVFRGACCRDFANTYYYYIYFIYFKLLHFYYNKFLYVYIFYYNMEHLKEKIDKSTGWLLPLCSQGAFVILYYNII